MEGCPPVCHGRKARADRMCRALWCHPSPAMPDWRCAPYDRYLWKEHGGRSSGRRRAFLVASQFAPLQHDGARDRWVDRWRTGLWGNVKVAQNPVRHLTPGGPGTPNTRAWPRSVKCISQIVGQANEVLRVSARDRSAARNRVGLPD